MATAEPTAPAGLKINPTLVIVSGCLIAMIAFGVRSTMGLFTAPITEANGWGRETFGLAMALQNLVWGAAQPFAGAFADKFGSFRVIIAGAAIYAIGTALMAVADNALILHLSGGLLMGLGIATTSFSIIMAAFGRLMPPEKRSWAFGIATAASSMGQFVFAPLGQAFIASFGWQIALFLLAGSVLFMWLLVVPLRAARGGTARDETELEMTIAEALSRAIRHPSFVLLTLGFFVCGFQVAFLTVHMPPMLVEKGIAPQLAAWSIGIVGLFNIIGAYSSGIIGGKYSRRYSLTILYLLRSIVMTTFFLLPITSLTTVLFAACMGLLWLSTVPLTMGLVTVFCGTRYMAMLYGIVFFSHQVGSFLGVWLGGRLYDQTGGYDAVWWMGVALGLVAALMHWPIKEARAPSFALPEPAKA
jgi:predicted MFS family arabinose efflux permease